MNGDDEEEQPPREFRRSVPQSDLDFNLMTTDPVWGQPKNEELKAILGRLDGILSIYTRDMRLANLAKFDELPQVRTLNSLGGDLIFSEMPMAAAVCIHKSANILETSQSKNGFLRRRMNTFTQEQFKTEMEPPKKSLFGGQKREPGTGY